MGFQDKYKNAAKIIAEHGYSRPKYNRPCFLKRKKIFYLIIPKRFYTELGLINSFQNVALNLSSFPSQKKTPKDSPRSFSIILAPN